MNATNMAIKSPSVVKKGDVSTKLVFELQDQTGQIINENGPAVVSLENNKGQVIWSETLEVKQGEVSFHLPERILPGTYSVEAKISGYVFPSEWRGTYITVTKPHNLRSEKTTDEKQSDDLDTISDDLDLLSLYNLSKI